MPEDNTADIDSSIATQTLTVGESFLVTNVGAGHGILQLTHPRGLTTLPPL